MGIDWGSVAWVQVAILCGLVFVAAFVGNALSFRNRVFGAILAAIFFGVLYILWTYYLQAPAPTRI
jgi:hypothetical protein